MNQNVDRKLLDRRVEYSRRLQLPNHEWVEFCLTMLDLGLFVWMSEPKSGGTRYITVVVNGSTFKVRFSDHPPGKSVHRVSDYFVGGYKGAGDLRGAILDVLRWEKILTLEKEFTK